jgi:hypothetical protein
MGNPDVEITCYIPTKNRAGVIIDDKIIRVLIGKIWPKYRGATVLTGTGYYRPLAGQDEIAECHVLTIVTEMSRSIKNADGELAKLKAKIEEELDQESVLITWHHVNSV